MPKKPIVETPVQSMVNLRANVKSALDEMLEDANAARKKAELSKINRSDLVSLMIKKTNKSDYLSSNF